MHFAAAFIKRIVYYPMYYPIYKKKVWEQKKSQSVKIVSIPHRSILNIDKTPYNLTEIGSRFLKLLYDNLARANRKILEEQ